VIEITYRPRSRRRARTKLLTQKYPKTTSIATETSSCLLPALCGRQAARKRTAAANANRAKIPKKTPETSSPSTPESRTKGLHTASPKRRVPCRNPRCFFRAWVTVRAVIRAALAIGVGGGDCTVADAVVRLAAASGSAGAAAAA